MNLKIEIDRKSGVPIYIQLKEGIKRLIETGYWEAGQKIPTERELAEMLNISRNTVSMAYKELEGEGILVSTQGRGTFITDSDAVLRQEGRKERLLRIIDVALEEAAEMGFSLDEFVAIAHVRAREKKEMLARMKIAFVECNREQLDYFSREMHLGMGITILPILLEDFRRQPAKINQVLENVDLVVSTFFHLQEVKQLVADKKKTVLGIALNPEIETIVRIARYPQGSKLAIVCLSETFAAKIRAALKQAGLNHLQLLTSISHDEAELTALLQDVDAVIVSPNRKKEIQTLAPRLDVIEMRFLPDPETINVIKSALLELKDK
ncbi:GntR family transcriptional regulator [Carboxydocella sporoproducens DSM 16521]|uniref:GntR family transcriptional regulator n=2 Tax=Carboxydocella TaxID=178898 RepID=A0A1T4LFN3_9FIRM|nr:MULTISPECIES: GntR family transcriptional regulator [Carboxydocella]AVX19813.1 transcriptional regulator, GntR family [Carboxydocella thermautotrophica]AVX30222.1 transcriptional regulator, GntR family [Carboxydocella thermautotrophica]SJZ53378.1 GntR family transcriptional regulator [Carboxydocella sporoproducens DSM 16521]